MKKDTLIRGSLVVLIFIGTLLILSPFFKTALISYQIETMVIHQTSSVPNNIEEKREWIQPPTLGEVLKSYAANPTFASVGRVVVPAATINAPVFSELINENLLVGSGLMFPERNPEKENMVLIGHHLSDKGLLFGALSNVKIGDRIYFAYLNHYYCYQAEEIMTVEEHAVEVMANRGRGEITLITCDSPSITDQRVVVKGILTSDKTEKQVQKQIEKIRIAQTSNRNKAFIFLQEFKWLLLIIIMVLFLSTYAVRKWI